MTFKQFVQWYNERACDGYWGIYTALQCIEVMKDVKSQPLWQREKYWKHHYMHSTVIEMVEKTNQWIKVRLGDGNG